MITSAGGRSAAVLPLPLTQVPALSLFEFLAQDLAHLARRDWGLGTVYILRKRLVYERLVALPRPRRFRLEAFENRIVQVDCNARLAT